MRYVIEFQAGPSVHEIIESPVHGLLAAFDVEHLASFVLNVIGSAFIVLAADLEEPFDIFIRHSESCPAVDLAVRLRGVGDVGGSESSGKEIGGTAVGFRVGGIVGYGPEHLAAGLRVLAVVTPEKCRIIRAEGISHVEYSLTDSFGLSPAGHSGVDFGVQVETGKKSCSRALVRARVKRAGSQHRALVGHQVGKFAHTVVEDLRAGGLWRGVCASERGLLGGERNRAEAVQGDPVEIGPYEPGLSSECVDLSRQGLVHAS